MLAKQALYYLSHSTNPHPCLGQRKMCMTQAAQVLSLCQCKGRGVYAGSLEGLLVLGENGFFSG
jgi:hypothetical protein